MSLIVPADHHVTFAGWAADKSQSQKKSQPWSGRKRVGFIVLAAMASWMLVLSPYFLLR